MQRFIGEEFEGMISGITGFGIFIELKRYPIEGLVPIASIGNDYYVFEESTMTLVGKKSGRTFHLGDKVKVAIEKIDIINQEMDLALVR